MAKDLTQETNTETMALVIGELVEAFGGFLIKLAQMDITYPGAFQAYLKLAEDPLKLGSAMVSDLSEEQVVLLIKASYRFSKMQSEFLSLPPNKQLAFAKDLQSIGRKLTRSVRGS